MGNLLILRTTPIQARNAIEWFRLTTKRAGCAHAHPAFFQAEDTGNPVKNRAKPLLAKAFSDGLRFDLSRLLSRFLPSIASNYNSLQSSSGQKRDRLLIALFLLMLLWPTLVMTVADHFRQRERSREEVERAAVATIDRLLAEFGDRLKAGPGKTIGAIYIRYSTSLQDSFEA